MIRQRASGSSATVHSYKVGPACAAELTAVADREYGHCRFHMRVQRSHLVRVMSEEEIRAISGTLPYVTSLDRNWTGIEIHRYRLFGPSDRC